MALPLFPSDNPLHISDLIDVQQLDIEVNVELEHKIEHYMTKFFEELGPNLGCEKGTMVVSQPSSLATAETQEFPHLTSNETTLAVISRTRVFAREAYLISKPFQFHTKFN